MLTLRRECFCPALPSRPQRSGEGQQRPAAVQNACRADSARAPRSSKFGHHAEISHNIIISKTPTANHRRPLPLWKRLCGRRLGQSLAQLSGQLFPESVWKDFGERVGEQEEEPWGPLGASWVPLWPSQGVPDLSNAVGSRLRGLSEPTWGPLGALQGRLGGHLGARGARRAQTAKNRKKWT